MLAWEEFIQHQEEELGNDVVKNWLRTLKVLNFDACNLYLEAKDTFHINWFEEHIRKRVVKSLLNNNKKKITVHLSVEKGAAAPKKAVKKGQQPVVEEQKFVIAFDQLDPLCTFDQFVEDPTNSLTYKFLTKVAGYNSGKMELGSFNPIYCYGASGSGKTHLLMAFAQFLRQQGRKVNYVRAETFTEHVVTAIRSGEMSLFRQSYRNTDVLIIDDVHLFARKNATQEELFHTFNALHLSGMQIVLSANCTPSELAFIEPRLISRFEWGIILPLEEPSKEMLKKIVQAKVTALKCSLPEHVVELLVDLFPSGCKAIIRAVEALILRTHLSKNSSTCTLTVPAVQKYLSDLIEEEKRNALTPQKIIHIVTEYFGIPEEEILGKSQSRDCVLPRQIAMYLCRTELEMTYAQIGDLFSRDHSTVMSSTKSIQKGLESGDENIATSIHALHKKLRQ